MTDGRDKRSDYLQIDAKIFDALVESMHAKSLDKITVKDIASAAGISRTAFYMHFEDKYAVVETLEDRLLSELIELTKQFSKINLKERAGDEAFIPTAETYAWALRNRHFLAPLHSPNGDLSFADRVKKALRPYFINFVKANGVHDKYVEPVYQAIAAMEEYRMLMYISDPNPLPPEDMGRISGRMFRGLVTQFS